MAGAMSCVKRFGDEASPECGRPARLRWGIPLCDQCGYWTYRTTRHGALTALREFVDNQQHEPRWNYGVTYGLLLPNGRYKIGSVGKPERLMGRWQELSYSLGARVVPLVTEYGGNHLEIYRQAQFNASAVMSRGEQFEATPEILQYMAKGHCPAGQRALERFNRWQWAAEQAY